MSLANPKIAVIGSGYWGQNLVRNFHELGALECVCDVREVALTEARTKYNVRTATEFNSILEDPAVDGVVIAAPAAQHYDLARRALNCGKDVYVEKPLSLRVEEGDELVQLATERHRILMVGHILEYHPAILELKKRIREGELGKIRYIYSSRLNMGKLRTEENILWSFAPHDISAILFLLGEAPQAVCSQGGSYLDPRIYDTTLTTCEFGTGVKAHIFVSWLHPFKEQRLVVVGGKKMAVFDDVEPENKLVLYSHSIEWLDRMPVAHKDGGEVVPLPRQEPLRAECEHFLESIRTRRTPRTDGKSALRVLEVLSACEESLHKGGQSTPIAKIEKSYFAHPTAVIDPDCEIGEGTKIWHFSHVMAGAKMGRRCNLGQNVVISPGVKIGDNVKIQNNVSVYTGVELEDDVFCGPSMVFTNVINPRSHIVRKHDFKKTIVKKGASMGAHSTIVCGITLGRYSFVGAGAVVTHDVPDHALVVGVPATQHGWICYCGVRLVPENEHYFCEACGRKYEVNGCLCTELVTEQVRPNTVAA